MKKIIKYSLAIVSLAALTNVAQAATTGAYLGAGLGYSKLDTPHEYLITGVMSQFYHQSRQYGGLGGRVFGGYNLNEYVGLEAGVSQYAKSKYETRLIGSDFKASKEFTMTTFDLVGKAYLPVGGTGLNVYGLGGVALVHSKISPSTKNGTMLLTGLDDHSKTQNKLRPKFGVGASYDIPETKLTTNLEWSRIQGTGNTKKSVSAIPNADMVTLNLAYKFD